MNKKIYIFFLVVVCFSLYFYEKVLMFNSSVIEKQAYSETIFIVLMFFSTLFVFIFSKKNTYKNKPIQNLTFCTVAVYLISISYATTYPFLRNNYMLIILPLLMMFFSSAYFIYLKNKNVIIWMMTIVFFLLSYYFIENYHNNIFYEINSQSNASYTVLYLLPFLLCHEQKLFRNIAILTCLFVIMLSLKRGGFIALLFAIMNYIIVYYRSNIFKRLGFKSVVFFLPLIIISFVTIIVYLNTNYLGGNLSERFADSIDSGGNGRLEIYEYYWNLITSASDLNFYIGHGWDGSLRVGKLGFSCHNDFLEVLFDFGIIGFILYVVFLISLTKYCLKMIRNNHEFAPAMAASLAMFISNSMVSHIFIYPRYMILFCFFWGFVISSNDFVKNVNTQ